MEPDDMSEPRLRLYIGTYTGTGSEGIYVCDLEPLSGELHDLRLAAACVSPSFLTMDPGNRVLYTVSETAQTPDGPGGAVLAFRQDCRTGLLEPINRQPSCGTYPCHAALGSGAVWVANYGSGTVAAFPVRADGGLEPADRVFQHRGTGPNTARQEGPHAHSVTLSPDRSRVIAADLGIDRLLVYREQADGGEAPVSSVALPPGSGPRHLAFHPSGRYAYCINELTSAVSALDWDAETGVFEVLQTVPALPEGFEGSSTCADIHVSADGRFVYGSNRGHDSIVVFRIDPVSGLLSLSGHAATGGRTPRNFALDPTGRYLLTANQDSDEVLVFVLDPDTGIPGAAVGRVAVPKPVCLRFAPPACRVPE
jgi:6-phosphogluconolactonase